MNNAVIAGRIAEDLVYDHEINNHQFYRTKVRVENGLRTDYVPVLIDKKFFTMCGRRPEREDFVRIVGPIRTINYCEESGTHLMVRIIAREFFLCEDEEEQVYHNSVQLKGRVCSDKGTWRIKSGQEKRDLVVATYREYGRKRDYINCPVWKKRELDISHIEKGMAVMVEGRFHSRSYFKYTSRDSAKGTIKEVYEVTVDKITAVQ